MIFRRIIQSFRNQEWSVLVNDESSDWEILLAYFQASQLAVFFTSSATYDELKSGGELVLIPDTELRKGLANYFTNADNSTLSERPVYRVRVRGIIPIEIQVYIWENCWETNEYSEQELIDCVSPVSGTELTRLLYKASAPTHNL